VSTSPPHLRHTRLCLPDSPASTCHAGLEAVVTRRADVGLQQCGGKAAGSLGATVNFFDKEEPR
jgi:hypothetical protein